MPRREARFAVNAPPEALWRFLRDFESLCACIPGVERIRVLDDETVELTVKEKVGVVPLIVNLTASIDAEEPPRRLHATARAEHLSMAIEVLLAPAAAGTELRSLFEVEGKGPLKPVVDRLFEKRADERSAQFAATLESRFGAVAPASAAPPERPGWLRRWLGGLWRRLTSTS